MATKSEWSIPFKELAEKVGKRMERAFIDISDEVFTRVIMRTPVDTGRLVANWHASLDKPLELAHERTDIHGTTTISNMRGVLEYYKAGRSLWLSNSLPYAAVIEYGGFPNPPKLGTGLTVGGFSIKAPAGMVRVSVQEVSEIVASALAKQK